MQPISLPPPPPPPAAGQSFCSQHMCNAWWIGFLGGTFLLFICIYLASAGRPFACLANRRRRRYYPGIRPFAGTTPLGPTQRAELVKCWAVCRAFRRPSELAGRTFHNLGQNPCGWAVKAVSLGGLLECRGCNWHVSQQQFHDAAGPCEPPWRWQAGAAGSLGVPGVHGGGQTSIPTLTLSPSPVLQFSTGDSYDICMA